ncbi:MAG: integrase core domain-containing protein, partial [Fuerstiella sp.]
TRDQKTDETDASPEKFDAHRRNPVQLTTWMNAYMERWFRSLKSECLDRMMFFGQRSLERAVREYVQHYHGERNHQGLGNELIEPEDDAGSVAGRIECRERLGGMLKYYLRRAA